MNCDQRQSKLQGRVVTPLFLGDGRQSPQAMRVPSVKGALRFWWRALNWERLAVGSRGGVDPGEALQRLHDEEAFIFGCAASEERPGLGQGRVLMQLGEPPKGTVVADYPKNQTGAGYLGFGLFPMKETRGRSGIKEGGSFSLRMRFKPDLTATQRDQVNEALKAWSLFGGLGSRSRRGFGSIHLESIDGELLGCANLGEYRDRAAHLLARFQGKDLPPFTAFSGRSRFEVIATANDARGALEKAGHKYKSFRVGEAKPTRREKTAFGLPLAAEDTDNRRGGSLFFHIHPLSDGGFAASALLLPAYFHHDYPNVDDASRFAPVERFLREAAL